MGEAIEFPKDMGSVEGTDKPISEGGGSSSDDAGWQSLPDVVDGALLGWILDNAPVILAIFDQSGVLRHAKGKGLELAGMQSAQLLGKTFAEIFPDQPGLHEVVLRCLGGETNCISLRAGSRYYDACCAPISHKGQIWVAVVATDVTESVAAAEALETEEELLRATIESVREAVVATDSDADITLFNRAAEALTGWKRSEARGRPLGEVVRFVSPSGSEASSSSGLALSSIETATSIDAGPGLVERKDGSTVEVVAHYAPIRTSSGKVVGALLTMRDVTEERRRDEELIRLEKLESLALMASGLSHDFNNMLAAIVANLGLAKEQADVDSALEFIEEAEKACQQARELTNKLASFARPVSPKSEPVSLQAVVDEALTLALVGRDVDRSLHIPADLWPVLGDRAQLVQVFSNLFLNAAQAMPGGGCITVRAENLVLTDGEPRVATRLQPGRYVKVIVEDQGIGIPQEYLQKVFDPYFTTKPTGTGLGLPTAFSIVRRHGGYMSLSSEVGKGTVVIVYLPAAPTAGRRVGETEQAPSREGRTAASTGARVLVLDDEETIRKAVRSALEGVDFQVDEAEDAVHAIERFREALEKDRPYDVVLIDLSLPGGLGGEDTLYELQKLDPSVRAVALSGSIGAEDDRTYLRRGFSGVVSKPFDLAKLRSEVASAADSKKQPRT